MPTDDSAGDAGRLGCVHNRIETILRGRRDRHEHLVSPGARNRAIRFVQAADDTDPEDAPPTHPRVVVQEADDPCFSALAQLPRQSASGATRAGNQHPASISAVTSCLREETKRQP